MTNTGGYFAPFESNRLKGATFYKNCCSKTGKILKRSITTHQGEGKSLQLCSYCEKEQFPHCTDWQYGAIKTVHLLIKQSSKLQRSVDKLKDLPGLSLVDKHIIPHYSKFIKKFDALENICKVYEQEHGCSVVRLNDGDGIIVENEYEALIIGS